MVIIINDTLRSNILIQEMLKIAHNNNIGWRNFLL